MQVIVRVTSAKVVEGKLGRQPHSSSGDWVEEVDLHVFSHGDHPTIAGTADAPLSGLRQGELEGPVGGEVEQVSGAVGAIGLGEHEFWEMEGCYAQGLQLWTVAETLAFVEDGSP